MLPVYGTVLLPLLRDLGLRLYALVPDERFYVLEQAADKLRRGTPQTLNREHSLSDLTHE